MSRFYGRLHNGGKPVQREGHASRGIVAHVFGRLSGVRVQATANGPRDTFEVYATAGGIDVRTGADNERFIGTVTADDDGAPVFIARMGAVDSVHID